MRGDGDGGGRGMDAARFCVCFSNKAGSCALCSVCASAARLATRAAGECSHRRIRRQSRHPSRRADFFGTEFAKTRVLLAGGGGTSSGRLAQTYDTRVQSKNQTREFSRGQGYLPARGRRAPLTQRSQTDRPRRGAQPRKQARNQPTQDAGLHPRPREAGEIASGCLANS